MEQELIKDVVKVGNSAGIILPKNWLNGKAHVKLIKKPLNLKQDILKILESYLEDVLGIYIVGSYAREEQTKKSDVDVLVITEKENKRIIEEKYDILLISEDKLKETLNKNVLPLLPMIKEAKPIINPSLLKNYVETPLTNKNLKFHIDLSKSAMKMQKTAIELAEMQNENMSDNIMYSLILRLRQTYIVDCLIKNKKQNKNDFLKLVRQLTGSEKTYEAYIRSKNDEKRQEMIPIIEAKKIYDYLKKKIIKQEKWAKRRK